MKKMILPVLLTTALTLSASSQESPTGCKEFMQFILEKQLMQPDPLPFDVTERAALCMRKDPLFAKQAGYRADTERGSLLAKSIAHHRSKLGKSDKIYAKAAKWRHEQLGQWYENANSEKERDRILRQLEACRDTRALLFSHRPPGPFPKKIRTVGLISRLPSVDGDKNNKTVITAIAFWP